MKLRSWAFRDSYGEESLTSRTFIEFVMRATKAGCGLPDRLRMGTSLALRFPGAASIQLVPLTQAGDGDLPSPALQATVAA